MLPHGVCKDRIQPPVELPDSRRTTSSFELLLDNDQADVSPLIPPPRTAILFITTSHVSQAVSSEPVTLSLPLWPPRPLGPSPGPDALQSCLLEEEITVADEMQGKIELHGTAQH